MHFKSFSTGLAWLGLAVLALTAACGSSDATPSGAAPSAGAAGAALGSAGASPSGGTASTDPNAVVGSFIIDLVGKTDSSDPYVAVSGKVYDGVTPSTVVWDLVTSAAGCQLLKPRAPFCNTPCSGGVCVEDDQCASYPNAQDLGPVTIQGLGSADIVMKAIANSYQLPGDVTLAFPPAAEGVTVGLQVSGGPFGAFTIQTKMITPLVASGALSLDAEKPLDLTWVPPSDPSLARMQVKVDISHHGGAKGKIECDVADSGSLQIPASLVSSLIDLGVAGFPTATLTRITSGSTAIAPGKVSLQTLSSVALELVVPGFQSCHEDTDCASGKTCQQDLTCTR
ncbi:MAG: hypothetical protein ABIQ16_13900 [Polyangiaceae bacterium]